MRGLWENRGVEEVKEKEEGSRRRQTQALQWDQKREFKEDLVMRGSGRAGKPKVKGERNEERR